MIYFCLPCHNEAETVGLVLWKIRRVLEDTQREYQILVGDDASTDATAEVLTPYQRVLPLTVIRNQERLGYAATVERLFKEALRFSDRHKRDVAFLLPADFSGDPDFLPDFLRKLDSGADVVVGEATLEGEGDIWRKRLRRWAPRLLGRRARVEGVQDLISGYLAFRLVTLRHTFRDRSSWLDTEGWAANAELIARTTRVARRLETVPVIERADRHPRVSRFTPWTRARELWSARHQLATIRSTPPARERLSPAEGDFS